MMSDYAISNSIHIDNIDLWAHVGVLEEERLLGQLFNLNITLWIDMENAAKYDDLSLTFDYSLAVKSIQNLSNNINCKTIEHFSDLIFDRLENLYGSIPMQIVLTKCSPPINGFSGSVAVSRKINLPKL